MSVITFLFWYFVIRGVVYLLIIGTKDYPRKIENIKLGSDLSSIIITILICVWLGLVKYGFIGVNL